MKRTILYIIIIFPLLFASCYKDLGNYDYEPPEEPIVTGVKDSVFTAFVGDSLIIKPGLTHSLAEKDNFSFHWEIHIPQEARAEHYEGNELRIVFGLRPGRYKAILTVTDHSNDMKYFYVFHIEGKTEFTSGTIILSDEGGTARLSFLKPDNTLMPRLYERIHDEQLPNKPLQLIALNEPWNLQTMKAYWILCAEGENPGIILDAGTMIREKYINEMFFDVPSTIKIGSLMKTERSGITTGVVNGKLHMGTTSTAPFHPMYGMYNNAAGDYELAPQFIYAEHQYYVGYDINKKRFAVFSGQGAFLGTSYQITPTGPGFNPNDVGLDLLHMQYLNGSASYAFGRDADGEVFEMKFFNAPGMFFPSYMKSFTGAELLKTNTKWAGISREIIFFSSGDKIYRYNPLNEEIRTLDADLNGLDVSMLKATVTGDTLVTATEGNLYYLDISTGRNGNIIGQIEGIPGAPVDYYIKK